MLINCNINTIGERKDRNISLMNDLFNQLPPLYTAALG